MNSKKAVRVEILEGRLKPGCMHNYGLKTHREIMLWVGLPITTGKTEKNKIYTCPCCEAQVLLKEGKLVDAYFSYDQ